MKMIRNWLLLLIWWKTLKKAEEASKSEKLAQMYSEEEVEAILFAGRVFTYLRRKPSETKKDFKKLKKSLPI